MTQTIIYIGLNNAATKTQIFETEKYIKILKEVCFAYHTSFSFDVIEGGYIHDSGEYTKENSLQLTLIDVDKKRVEEIAKDLCAFFHQESVLITENTVRSYYVRESIS